MDELEKKRKALEIISGSGEGSILDQDVIRVKGTPELPEPVKRIKGVTEHIDTKTPLPVIGGGEFKDKIAKLRALKTLGKKLPMVGSVVGGIGAMLGSEDASAAVPILNEAENLGPEQGSFDDRLEKGLLTEEEKQLLKKQMEGN